MFTPDTPATRRAFNRLAREKMKLRLLADIRMDLMVCELEGWDKLEYLDELLALVRELKKGGGGRMTIAVIFLTIMFLYTTYKWWYYFALSATLALYTQEKHIEPTEAEVALYARKLADDFWGKWLRS